MCFIVFHFILISIFVGLKYGTQHFVYGCGLHYYRV